MEAPLIVSLSRQMAVKDVMTSIANNIANMSTPGYKGERLMFKNYVARLGDAEPITFPQQAGLFRFYNAGPIQRTSNPLDIALRGDGFLVVETPGGPRYTRNGHLSLDAQGQIVTTQGYPVLDQGDQPIVIDAGVQDISIAADGRVSADGNEVGQIKTVKFGDPQGLERQGGTLFKTDALPLPTEDMQILQGHIEGSNIEPIVEITRFMSATGAYQSAKNIIDDEHDRMRRAIETLGSMPQ